MFRIFKNLSKKDWGIFGISLIFIVMQVWLDLKMPDYMATITRLIGTQGTAVGEVIRAGGKMLLCALGSLALAMCVTVAAARISADFSANTRKKLFDRIQALSTEQVNHFSPASLITRMTNDITQVERLIVLGMQMMIKAPILAVWAMIKISGKDWHWTAATAITVACLLLLVALVIGACLPKFREVQRLTDEVNRVARENLTGLKVVRAYNAEQYQEEKFEKVNADLTNNHLFTSRRMAMMLPGIMLMMNGLTLAIYWIGAYLIEDAGLMNKMTLFADMVVFMSYAMQVVMAFMMLLMIFMIYPRAAVAAGRVLEVLDAKPSLQNGDKQKAQDGHAGEIAFQHVSFRYPDAQENVLTDITFTAHSGETVAIIGSTGDGKSTLLNLIPRFYDATQGEVLVGGVNVKDYDQRTLRQQIGYVSQSAVLFAGSIASNIGYGDNGKGEITPEQIRSAAQVSEAAEFIEGGAGYDGYVAQGGANLSGGQRQRVSIARAIARGAKILLFDDSFSALDYRTDRKVRSNLRRACQDVTRIIVAQRIGTIRDADKILVLEEGRIVGQGTHEELLRTCETYQQIALSQLSKEELEA